MPASRTRENSTAGKIVERFGDGIVVFIACLATYKLIGYIYFLVLSTHYSWYIPTAFEIDKAVFAEDRIGGFIEGCGVAIFELSEKTSASVSEGGIAFLNNNSTTRDSTHKQYMSWQGTSVAEPSKHYLFLQLVHEDAGGNTCVDLPRSLREDISLAISSPGGFYSGFNKNTELLVIPALHLAVFSHDR